MTYKKRLDGRKFDETREMEAQVGIIKSADGSAMFRFGETIAIASVFGPKPLHPQHLQDPSKGLLRCRYDMLTFSVPERKRPGPSRRSHEISKVTEWALSSMINLEDYPNTVVDVHIKILQANASTRCAGINAAALALAESGVSMKELVSSVSMGKLDNQLVVDVDKNEEDYSEGEGATDIPLAFLSKSKKVSLFQMDGNISSKDLLKAIEMGKKAAEKVYQVQKKALKEIKLEK